MSKPRQRTIEPARTAIMCFTALIVAREFVLPNAVIAQGSDSSSGSSLKSETPSSSQTGETQVATPAGQSEKPDLTNQKPPAQVSIPPHKATMLFGRIEQIAGRAGAQFPTLKALTPKLDLRATTTQLKAKTSETQLSGTLVNAFPKDYSGNWGGTLTVWWLEQDPIAYQVDADEAKWTAAAIKKGLTGDVNFDFARAASGKITLEPAQISFMVPLQDTYASTQMNQLFNGGQGGQMGGLMQSVMGSMAGSMKVPVQLYLGNCETTGLVTGVSGNQLRSTVLKNEIRELSPGVLEQQLVTYQVSRNAKTGAQQKSYGETVLRFTRQTADQFYVQAAIVAFTEARHFKDKIILYGTVRKGQVVQSQSESGFSDLNKIMGSPGAGAGSAQMPAGQIEEQIRKMLNP